MYGIQSTFDEELYTTKLDPNRISKEKREKADRIAKEIESGIQHADQEERCLGGEGDDEESKFSSVPRGRGSGKDGADGGAGGASSSLARFRASAGEQANLTSDNLTRHNSGLAGDDDGFALEHRTKRGMITANSPMRPPMVSEMKRINALNLEPALPKLDDKTRTDWINFKQQQTRHPTRPERGVDVLKVEFENALKTIQQREALKQQGEQGNGGAMPSGANETPAGAKTAPAAAGSETPAGDDTPSRSKSFALNPAAKPFTFSASAAVFWEPMLPSYSSLDR